MSSPPEAPYPVPCTVLALLKFTEGKRAQRTCPPIFVEDLTESRRALCFFIYFIIFENLRNLRIKFDYLIVCVDPCGACRDVAFRSEDGRAAAKLARATTGLWLITDNHYYFLNNLDPLPIV